MIRGYCVESGGNSARFLVKGKEKPQCGKTYTFDEYNEGTLGQTRLVRSLVSCFHKYMFDTNTFTYQDDYVCYNFSSPNKDALYGLLKRDYGLGFEKIKYTDVDYAIKSVTTKPPKCWNVKLFGKFQPLLQLPLEVLEDFGRGNIHRVEGVLVSWTDYDLKERRFFIDTVFKLMDIFGVHNAKYTEIKKGLDKIRRKQEDEERRKKEARRNTSQS